MDQVRSFLNNKIFYNKNQISHINSIKNIESYDNLKSHIIEQVNKINFATEEDKNFRIGRPRQLYTGKNKTSYKDIKDR